MKLSEEEFAGLVEEALRDIPQPFATYLENVMVEVEQEPDAKLLAEMEIDDATELLGIYHGIPLTERSIDDGVQLPDRITVFQRNIERMCKGRKQIIAEIRTTVLHEIGHHFGLDEDDLDELGYG